MKKFLIMFLCAATLLCFDANAEKNLEEQQQALLKQEKQLAKEMFQLRVKLLQKDPILKKMHEKIMELHKELALRLDSKKEMRILLSKLKKVKVSLAEVKQQIKDE